MPPTNPYDPPTSDVRPTWWDRVRQWWRGKIFDPFQDPDVPEFLTGHILMYDGVMFFCDPAEDWNLQLAIGIVRTTPENLKRNETEVRRVLKNFVGQYPEHAAAISDREVRLRFLSSYQDLESEVTDRIGLGKFSEQASKDHEVQN